MFSLRTKSSVRVPSFSGPFALAAGLLTVVCFSEPFWQNFYILEATAMNTTMKAGAWGICTRLRNATGVNGPTVWCTSYGSGYTMNYVYNLTSEFNQFPTVANDNILLGLGSVGSTVTRILSPGGTAALWLHVIAAILTIVTVASLVFPPSYLGHPQSRLFLLQKSGILTMVIGLTALAVTVATFVVDLIVILPAKAALNAIPGITASIGNLPWFTLPCIVLMIPAFLSVLMTSSQNKFAAL